MSIKMKVLYTSYPLIHLASVEVSRSVKEVLK